jgi:hypothetical protein
MVRRAYRQRSLIEVLLPDADKLWDLTLRRIDALLDDEGLIDRVAEALARRHPLSQRRGRLQRLGQRVRQRARRVARRVFEIAQRSRTAGHRAAPAAREQNKARMKRLYQELMGITRAVVRQAEAATARSRREPLAVQLSITIELVKRVVAQTRARVLRGDIHFPGNVVSLFEAHTEIIRKGKLAKPTEFGRLVKIQEAEGQFITDYEVCERGQAERALWEPALDRHIALSEHAPALAVADGGFSSRGNEQAARNRGVRHVVLPRQSREERSRAARAALRWRTGSEGRISALKRRMGCDDVGTEVRAECSDGSGSAASRTTCSRSLEPGHEPLGDAPFVDTSHANGFGSGGTRRSTDCRES